MARTVTRYRMMTLVQSLYRKEKCWLYLCDTAAYCSIYRKVIEAAKAKDLVSERSAKKSREDDKCYS